MGDDGVYTGTHTVAVPRGTHVAFTRNQSLLRASLTSRRQQQVAALSPAASSTVSFIRWSRDGSHILLVHDSGLLVFDSDSRSERARLQNGTGSLGHIASAELIGNHHLLILWEFGRARLFDINTSKSLDLVDLKTTCDGRAWQMRPGNASPPLFVLLSRASTGDQLSLHFSSLTRSLAPIKLQTLDAQSLSWSIDGRWLAILDVPTATPSLYIYTPDGHFFRSYPSSKEVEPILGIKSVSWSPDGQILALARHDGKVELLNTRTFTPLAIIEHSTTINQHSVPSEERAPIWLEHVSASGDRSYSPQAQPVSPPLSKTKADSDPKDLGVAELTFSCDGHYLATRDCRMLNTVWLWDMSTLAAYTVVIQHTNVRSLQWHSTRPDTLLIDCAEGFAHILDVASCSPPTIFPTQMRPRAALSWLNTASDAKPVILAVEKTRFGSIFPEGCDESQQDTPRVASLHDSAGFEEGASEDSLFEVLSGRKPLPPKTEPSYTEMIDLEMEEKDDMDGVALEDTFREKVLQAQQHMEVDPFDDSQIF